MAKKYGNDIRAKANAMFLTGESLVSVANSLNIDKSTCSRWKAAMPATTLQRIATLEEGDFDSKLGKYLHELLNGATNMIKTVSDPNYVRVQPAGGMAALIAVTTDRIFRLMEARQAAENGGITVPAEVLNQTPPDELSNEKLVEILEWYKAQGQLSNEDQAVLAKAKKEEDFL